VPEDRLRIKSLELNGFKSFGDKTVLRFEEGITAVVGPNGCGKSNVVDAMRWAMGEQAPRRLRGKSMEDVIFGGSEGRSGVGMAEVILSFENGDGAGPPEFASYNEIRIARRLYRSGESEYLINGTACRLRDVQDFFRDTGIGTKGYTIVEQGRIAHRGGGRDRQVQGATPRGRVQDPVHRAEPAARERRPRRDSTPDRLDRAAGEEGRPLQAPAGDRASAGSVAGGR
jgi:chromosome segregation ATPase